MLKKHQLFPRILLLSAACCALALPGCGRSEPDRYPLSGSVKFNGADVANGSIAFEPDRSMTGFAPTSYARIEGGKYQTLPNEGPAEGTYHVRVLLYDMSKVPPGKPLTELPPLLRPPYETTITVPVPQGVFDLEIPPAGN